MTTNDQARAPFELRAFDVITCQWSAVVTANLEDGTPVETPVNIARDAGRAFFATFASALKSRALHRRGEVAVAPCSAVGMAAGAAVPARIRLLGGREARVAARVLARAHPIAFHLTRALHLVMGQRTLVYEIVPQDW
jgi:PPOX class probable F420-dependent enzyme